MKFKQLLRAGMFVLVLCAVATALTYTWIGDGADDDWDTCGNWANNFGATCYPSTTSHDAIIPDHPGSPQPEHWYVDLITETIEDLTLEHGVAFGAAETNPTLTVDSLTIIGGAKVTITDATIVTN